MRFEDGDRPHASRSHGMTASSENNSCFFGSRSPARISLRRLLLDGGRHHGRPYARGRWGGGRKRRWPVPYQLRRRKRSGAHGSRRGSRPCRGAVRHAELRGRLRGRRGFCIRWLRPLHVRLGGWIDQSCSTCLSGGDNGLPSVGHGPARGHLAPRHRAWRRPCRRRASHGCLDRVPMGLSSHQELRSRGRCARMVRSDSDGTDI